MEFNWELEMALNTLIKGKNVEDAKKDPEIKKFLKDASHEQLELTVNRLKRAAGRDADVAAVLAQAELEKRIKADQKTHFWKNHGMTLLVSLAAGLLVLIATSYF